MTTESHSVFPKVSNADLERIVRADHENLQRQGASQSKAYKAIAGRAVEEYEVALKAQRRG